MPNRVLQSFLNTLQTRGFLGGKVRSKYVTVFLETFIYTEKKSNMHWKDPIWLFFIQFDSLVENQCSVM